MDVKWTAGRNLSAFLLALIGPDFEVNVTSVVTTVSDWGIVVLAIGLRVAGTCLVRRRHTIHITASA